MTGASVQDFRGARYRVEPVDEPVDVGRPQRFRVHVLDASGSITHTEVCDSLEASHEYRHRLDAFDQPQD